MSATQRTSQIITDRLLSTGDGGALRAMLAPCLPAVDPLCDRVPLGNAQTAAGLEQRQAFLRKRGHTLEYLCHNATQPL